MPQDSLPLSGLTVIEVTHMVMGPSMGLILADLGADVIRIEPPEGDPTRRLVGSGAGYFPMFNRNKRSICLDLKRPEGVALARRLVARADILIENFKPGTLTRLGLGHDAMRAANPRLIYCAAKGFLSGPYQERTALDEVAQMMGGLAYMTGPPGQPLRAGASVIDIAGGMFGVVAILALLERRHRTGRGGLATCALFETTAFLVGQHMAQMAVTGEAARPMPVRRPAWAIYDVFETRLADEPLFVAVVSDAQWRAFCAVFGPHTLGADPTLASNTQRVAARETLLPEIRALFRTWHRAALIETLERIGLPFAPIARPEDLFEDAHLNAAGGLLEVALPGGTTTRLPALPVEIDGSRLGLRRDVPAAGRDGADILRDLGLSESEIAGLGSVGA